MPSHKFHVGESVTLRPAIILPSWIRSRNCSPREPPPLESHCGRALSAAGHAEVEASEHTDYLCDLG
jgi:hypothetical protein